MEATESRVTAIRSKAQAISPSFAPASELKLAAGHIDVCTNCSDSAAFFCNQAKESIRKAKEALLTVEKQP
jgi:hypothetical protein